MRITINPDGKCFPCLMVILETLNLWNIFLQTWFSCTFSSSPCTVLQKFWRTLNNSRTNKWTHEYSEIDLSRRELCENISAVQRVLLRPTGPRPCTSLGCWRTTLNVLITFSRFKRLFGSSATPKWSCGIVYESDCK